SLTALYIPQTWTDPTTGLSATYYQVCDGCSRPTGIGNIAVTNINYRIYKGMDITATKRYSNRWQMATALTIQDNPGYFPVLSATYINPTGREFNNGISTVSKYVFKLQGSYTFKWDIAASTNFNWNQGGTRNVLITGPGQVYGGTTGTI